MTRGQNFIKNSKCTHGHRSTMSNSAWCELNKSCTVLQYTICAIILNVSAKNKLFSVQSNFNEKELDSKIPRKKYLRDIKQLGKNF